MGWCCIDNPKFIPCLVCVCFLFMGYPLLCKPGIIIFTMFDDNCTSSLILMTLAELLAVFWFSKYAFYRKWTWNRGASTASNLKGIFFESFNSPWFTNFLPQVGNGFGDSNCGIFWR